MKPIKITICFLTTLSTAATLTLAEAQARYTTHDETVQAILQQQLLLERKQDLNNRRHHIKASPIMISINDQKHANIQSKFSVEGAKDNQVAFEVNYQLQNPAQYQLTFQQEFLQKTQSLEDQIKQIEIEKLSQQYKAQYQQSILSFRQAYRQLVEKKLTLALHEKQLKAYQAYVHKEGLRFEHGEISKLDYQQAVNTLEKKALDALKSERLYTLSIIDFKQKIGCAYDDDIEVDTSFQYQSTLPSPQEAITAGAKNDIDYQLSLLNQQQEKLSYQLHKQSQRSSLKAVVGINQDQHIQGKVLFQLNLPSYEQDYQEAQALLSYTKQEQLTQKAYRELQHTVHQHLIQLEHLKALITWSEKHYHQQETRFKASQYQLEYGDIGFEEYEEALIALEESYLGSLHTQLEFINQYESFSVLIGQPVWSY